MEITQEMLVGAVACVVLYFGASEAIRGTKALVHKTHHGVARMLHPHPKPSAPKK